MLEKIFDAIVGFMLNRDLEKEVGIRHKFLKGKVLQIPSKILDRFIDFMISTRYTYYVKMRSNMLKGGCLLRCPQISLIGKHLNAPVAIYASTWKTVTMSSKQSMTGTSLMKILKNGSVIFMLNVRRVKRRKNLFPRLYSRTICRGFETKVLRCRK